MKVICLIGVLIIGFVLTGCGADSGSPSDFKDYRVGSNGLVIDFMSGNPDKFYAGEGPSEIYIEVRNEGAYPQSGETSDFKGYLCPGGFDKSIITVKEKDKDTCAEISGLEGKSLINTRGGFTRSVFSVDTPAVSHAPPTYFAPLILSIAYPYKTIASPMVCVDTSPHLQKIDKACDVRNYAKINAGDQGAPVAVTNIEEEATSKGLIFRITVKNVGGGKVVRTELIKDKPTPDKSYTPSEVDIVNIKSITLGGQPVTKCEPSQGQDLKLFDNEGQIFCKHDIGSDRVYESPLEIELDYGYISTIKKSIQVIKDAFPESGGSPTEDNQKRSSLV